jgi:L-iditol 2-dehydrogenase
MLAAVLDNIKEINVREFQNPTIPSNGAILKVHSCGICSSDLKFINHGDRVKEFPAILGHEIAGEIIEIDKNTSDFNVGDRVAFAAEIPCKKCRPCLNELENLCVNVLSIGTTIQGGFSEFMPLSKDLLVRGPINLIPQNLTYNQASLAETLGCVINAMDFCRMKSGKTVAIIGAGYMGCLMINVARLLGAKKIVMIDKDAKRLKRAEAFSADIYLSTKDLNSFVQLALNEVDNEGFDVVFAACSNTEAFKQSILLGGKGAYINLFGGINKNENDLVSFSSNFVHYRQITVGGTFSSTKDNHKTALNYLSSGKINTKLLISHKFNLSEFSKGIDVASSGNGLKIIINP